MRFWPFGKLETRETTDYSDAVITQILANAGQNAAGNASAVAALEACTGLWGRGFASADVSPSNLRTEALTPSVLETVGRALLVKGECLFEIMVSGGRLTLVPASSWTVTGGASPASWEYKLTKSGPSGNTTKTVTASRVVHVRIGATAENPWKGEGPLTRIATSKKLAASLETQLANDAATSHGYLIPVPQVETGLQADIRKLSGKATLVESVSSGWEAGTQKAPQSDFEPQRVGSTLDDLRESVARHIFAASGVHPSWLGNSDGTLARESFRQFLHATLKPVAKIIRGELRDKLSEPDLTISFDELGASDITGRARAFQGLVNGGMSIEKAAILSGLMIADDD